MQTCTATPQHPAETGTRSSSDYQNYDRWGVIRRKQRMGASYPIRLIFPAPLSEDDVRERIARWVERGHVEWREYKHFEIWPTAGRSPA